MCGIFTLLNGTDNIPDEIINESFNKGKNRGPEYSELKQIEENLLFGFHRLAINGLDNNSNQPMSIDGITLICNGEIYNYKELFSFMNIIPSTNSDCEVIIHLYKHYGIDYLLQLLDGVFAFVLYDSINEKVFAARDPYGVRPMYYLKTANNIIAYASEVKVLSPLMNYLFSISNDTNYSLMIHHVLPGSYMTFNSNKNKNNNNKNKENDTYWKINTNTNNNPIFTKYNVYKFSHTLLLPLKESYSSITNTYYNICSNLINAVKKRVIGTTDRPIACLLSGGLDSSLIAAIVSKCYPGQLETYSIGMKGSEDLRYAEMVANHIDSKHTSVIVSEDDFFNAIPEVIETIESYDTTTVRASVGNYLIGKYISENSKAKVIFNGDGSDELMGGYLYFQSCPNSLEFDKECKRLLTNIHMFDVLRSDKCISSHGLEPRTPFLDRNWVDYYLSIPLSLRCPRDKQIEKHLIRSAFAKFEPNLLPHTILWRKKEAFSDGVSGQHKSWFEIIADKVSSQDNNNDININKNKELQQSKKYEINPPTTKEQVYYREIFDKAYPNSANIIPYFWMPRFIESSDPSARTLDIYNSNK